MVKEEDIEVRLDMADMIETFLEDIKNAIDSKNFIEATWLCYAVFEQRITRLIEKHITYCPKKERTKNCNPVSISRKIKCIKNLIKNNYRNYYILDKSIFINIEKWCNKRNDLVHDLVRLESYYNYKKDFEILAHQGYDLILKLNENLDYHRFLWRNNKDDDVEFPNTKCGLEQKCIFE